MFCPHCGASNPDGSAFCSSCGKEIGATPAPIPTEPMNMMPEEQSPTAAYDSLGSDYQTPATVPDASPKKKFPMVAIVVVLLLAGVAGFAFADPLHVMPWSSKPSAQATSSAAESKSGQSGSAAKEQSVKDDEAEKSDETDEAEEAASPTDSVDHTGITLTEEAPNRISPKESIEVKDLKLEEDEYKRYVITGTVVNSSEETYNVDLDFSAIRHSSDKYGEEVTTSVEFEFDSITPFTTVNYHTLTVYDLKPGETPFTIYPEWDSVEEFLTDPSYSVRSVSLPDAKANWRYDHNNAIKIDEAGYKLTADGKLEMPFTNETGMYLNETTVTLVAYSSDSLPAVRNTYGDRPYGAVIESATVKTLKPGDAGVFTCNIGEGYTKVSVKNVSITPDPDKSSFN